MLIIFSVLLIFPLLMLFYERPEGQNRFGEASPAAGFLDAIKKLFYNYFNFSGRASRSEFWYAMLFYLGVAVVSGLLRVPDSLISIFLLATLIPFFSVTARRLHDTNRTGWLQFVSWFSPVGTIIAILWFSEPSRG